ncbi:Xaa-Pro aminopeptidase [Aneurinibacillus soli]|uniref:Xaa-Pro dipeptidase n=1 Tax=Aneurinibacillus soli TaxID=1500254 RepID=A0A0U4NES8_9BACL|nr:Xaa-Pro peptidase family protein [Aneurinibacillus soli]PYE63655.1 Xaa-Pro aminopeptidase [Aneurinibacillus soli]BAU27412.1 Xaa-Pro dipeptidase [Aneurinibacillus soli]
MNRISEQLQARGLDALLVTNAYNRRYVSGFTGTSGCCLLTTSVCELLTDFRYVEQATEQTKASGFSVVRHEADMMATAAERAARYRVKRLGFEKDDVSYSLYEKLQALFTNVELVPVSGIVEEMRLIKTANEIAIIQEAATIADRAFTHILDFIKPGRTELEVSNELEFFMRRQGATSSSFDTIVASGVRSALPHGVASNKTIETGDMVTLDFGAYYNGYCSDITRTIAVGEPGEKLREIYEIVLRAQLHGVAHVKAGMTGKEADALTRDIIAAAGYGPQFGHSTGHGIGLEIHEAPGLSFRNDAVLRRGMVVTVEPGIYLEGVGGVRIEDDVVLTESGCDLLTNSPKELLVL